MPALEYAGTRLIEYPEISRSSMLVVLNMDETDQSYTIHPIHLDQSACLVSSPVKEEAEIVLLHLQGISEALQKPYKTYRKFYNANKQRKLLPTQVRNRHFNRFRLWLYYGTDRMVRNIEMKLPSVLNRLGLLSFVKRRMSSLLQYLHSNR